MPPAAATFIHLAESQLAAALWTGNGAGDTNSQQETNADRK